MQITLIQPVQNKLYDFTNRNLHFTKEESLSLSAEMQEQTCSLIENIEDSDLIITTEAVNYPGSAHALSCPVNDLIDTDKVERRFADLASKKHSYLLAALYVNKSGNKLYNEAILYDRDGNVAARYDKIHLAGEEQEILTRGKEYCIVDTDFGRIGICICWDMQFPEVCRYYAIHDVPLVVCPTWGWESIYAYARAYENGIWVAGAMSVPYNGRIEGIRTPSEIVAPDGTVFASAPCDKACALTAEIDLSAMRELHDLRMRDRQPWSYKDICSQ